MLVIADTSPLHYLFLIDEIDLLPKLYEQVMIPTAVMTELQDEGASKQVRLWIEAPPGWLQVRTVEPPLRAGLLRLDAGEREAIELALRVGAGLLLIDERRGRAIAASHRLQVQGTLAVILKGAQAGFCDFEACVSKLKDTNIYLAEQLIEQARQEYQFTLRMM